LLTIRRNLVRQNGKITIKETKTHQMRVVSLDPATVAILTAHKERAQRRCIELGTTLDDDTFVFSYAPDHRRHCDPDGITHRYTKMTADLGIDTHLHALRHYSATELIADGVDVRTVVGRLGHGGGGATTLRVYAAWLAAADKSAAGLLASRLPKPPQFRA
jgi:integrase